MWAEIIAHEHRSARQRERDLCAAHIAGLKEARDIVDRHRKGWTVSAATAGLVAEVMQTASEILSEAIAARIEELEKGNT